MTNKNFVFLGDDHRSILDSRKISLIGKSYKISHNPKSVTHMIQMVIDSTKVILEYSEGLSESNRDSDFELLKGLIS